MKVSKSDAVRIFVEVLDVAAAKTWDDKQLTKKLQVLNDEGIVTKDDLKRSKDKKLVELVKKVMAALADDQEVTLVAEEAPAKKAKDEKPAKAAAKKKAAAKDEDEDDDSDEGGDDGDDGDSEDEDEESDSDDDDADEDEDEEDEKPAKKGKVKTKAKDEKPAKKAAKKAKDEDDEDSDDSDDEDEEKPKKKPAAKKGGVDRDEWGVKIGTRTSRINAALSDKPKTMAQLQELAKATGISSHLSKLKELKLIKKTDEGYARTKEGMKGYDPARAKKILKGG